MGEQTGGHCNCQLCVLGRKLGAAKDKLNAEEIAALNELWNRCEEAETDLAVAERRLSAIKKLCDGGLTATMDVLERHPDA